jgi:hypothetical protein
MRTFLTTATLVAAFSMPALADVAKTPNLDDGVMANMTEICSDGCVIRIDLDRALYEGQMPLPRKYVASAYEDPMAYMVGFDLAQHDMIMFELVSEPGSPVFFSLGAVVDYMEAQPRPERAGS